MPFLEVNQLAKTYADGTVAVRGIDLSIERGEFIVLLGPSGCGKTTTLRMVAGLELPTAGRISLDGSDVTMLRPALRDIGFVFQFYALYPHLNVRENIAFPLRAVGIAKREAHRQVDVVADRLRLGALLDRHPRHLSGGDQQRVSLARAMVRSPKLWLMDEPLGTLDHAVREDLREFIREQQMAQGVTTLYVTHDQDEAMTLADRIVVMENGVIRQVASPAQVYDHPADRFTATFVGSPGMSFIPGRVAAGSFTPAGATAGFALSGRAHVGDGELVLGVRGEWVGLASASQQPHLTATVEAVEYLGSVVLVHAATPQWQISARVAVGTALPAVGQQAGFVLNPAGLRCFDAASGAAR